MINSARSLNILLLFPHFNSPEQAGSMRSWQIGRFLAKRGHRVTVFAPGVDLRSGELFPEVRGKLYAELEVEGVRLIRPYSLPHFRRSAFHRLSFELIYAVLSTAKALRVGRVDVIVAAYPPAAMPFFAYLLARMLRVPYIFEMRDLMAEALSATGYVKLRLFNKLALRLENYVAEHCDHVICVTPGIKKVLQSRGIDGNNITVVTNGYEPEVFEAVDYSWNPRERYDWTDRFVVVYAGGLTQAYDLLTLLRAAERLKNEKDILFVIIGEGDRKQDYLEFCKVRSLTNVQFIGYQRRKVMPNFLKSADVGVHLFPDDPLWTIVLGNKTFDYLGSGLPMLYAGRGDTADLIRKSQAGIVVEPEDDQELAGAIVWLKNHRNKAKSMGKLGREYVTTHYNRHKLLETFEKVNLLVTSNRNSRNKLRSKRCLNQ
jgi:glycosyltransferase involved in cell wall biosynthesis